ncbi:MAG: WXG100 family type VII secretion target [Oscillospiraceae bacterium]
MADNVLVYKFSELEQCSADMGKAAEALGRIRTELKRLTESADADWQGKAYSAFAERSSLLIKAAEKLYEQVNSNKSKLDKAIALQKQNEEDITKNTVGSLSASDIF